MRALKLSRAFMRSQLWTTGLANTLGFRKGEILSASAEKGIVGRSVVPPEAYLPGEPLSCGVLTALADEWTSQAIVIQDRQVRPGVTVAISLNMHNVLDVSSRGPLIFEATCSKIGKSMGFCDFSIFDERTKTLIATGQHTKYLPMGVHFRFLTHPWIFPFSFPIVSKTTLRPFDEVADANKVPTIQELYTPDLSGAEPTLRIYSAHANPLGAMHGGGIAIAAEFASRAAMAAPLSAAGAGAAPRAISVSIHIPSPVPAVGSAPADGAGDGGAQVAVGCEMLPRYTDGGPIASRASFKYNKRVCSSVQMTWATAATRSDAGRAT